MPAGHERELGEPVDKGLRPGQGLVEHVDEHSKTRHCGLDSPTAKGLVERIYEGWTIGTHGIDDPLAFWNTLNMSCMVIRALNHRYGMRILLRPDNKTNTALLYGILLLTPGGGLESVIPYLGT
jgi:hypothetical protein